MKVLKFSMGFGPKLLKKQGKETEYSLRLFPLGGFVQLEGEDEESSDERSFAKKPIWQRLLVLIAGVTMNIMIALIIYLCIYMSINQYTTTKISSDSDQYFLSQNGIKVGDTILKIDGEKVYNDEDVSRIIASKDKNSFNFELIDQNNNKYEREVTISEVEIGTIGVLFEHETVYRVMENGAGEKAGLKEGDKILAINDESGDILKYIKVLQENPNNELTLKLLRNEEEIELKITPASQMRKDLKISFIEIRDLDFFHNLYYAWNETKYYLRANLIGIGELLTGKAENVEVQGIVGISRQISRTETVIEFFYFMSAISLSLGIMNLFPIPGLDGGKILITLIELVRRKPMSKETEAKITLIGFAFLLGLMIYVTSLDISKLFR